MNTEIKAGDSFTDIRSKRQITIIRTFSNKSIKFVTYLNKREKEVAHYVIDFLKKHTPCQKQIPVRNEWI